MKFRAKSSITMGREYLPGEVIELSPEQAAAMPWAVEALPAEAKPVVEAKPDGTEAKSKSKGK